MSWSRKDILADIKKRKMEFLDNDQGYPISQEEIEKLPYNKLRAEYVQTRHVNSGVASGSYGHRDYTPPDSNKKEK